MKYSKTAIMHAIHSVAETIEQRKRQLPVPEIPASEDTLWRRLVECILGSQVPNAQAVRAATWLASQGLFSVSGRKRSPSVYRRTVQSALSSIPSPKQPSITSCLRFHRTKAAYISSAYERLYITGQGLRVFISDGDRHFDTRRKIAAAVPGIGPKQASLFMRNAHVSYNLAILDSQILRFMSYMRPSPGLPDVSSTRKYEQAETEFRALFPKSNMSVASLDFATWIVMRQARTS